MHLNWATEHPGEVLFTDVFSSNVRIRSSCTNIYSLVGGVPHQVLPCTTNCVKRTDSQAIAWFGLKRAAIQQFSDNSRLFEAGRDLCRSSGPTPLLKQGHLEPVVQDYAWMAFQYLQGWRIYSLSVQLVSALAFKTRSSQSDSIRILPVSLLG